MLPKFVESMQCGVCLENIAPSSPMIVTRCGHNFHIQCLYRYDKHHLNRPRCPCGEMLCVEDNHRLKQEMVRRHKCDLCYMAIYGNAWEIVCRYCQKLVCYLCYEEEDEPIDSKICLYCGNKSQPRYTLIRMH